MPAKKSGRDVVGHFANPSGLQKMAASGGADSRRRGTDGDDQPVGQDEKKKLTVGFPMVKAFFAGVVVSHLNKNLILGFVLGGLVGIYVHQNFSGVPDVAETWRDFRRRFRGSGSNDD